MMLIHDVYMNCLVSQKMKLHTHTRESSDSDVIKQDWHQKVAKQAFLIVCISYHSICILPCLNDPRVACTHAHPAMLTASLVR